MGMFDDISIEAELPLPEELKQINFNWKEHSFQTKDLENCMLKYVLKEDGGLFEHIFDREYIPWTEEEKKSKKLKTWDLWKEVIEKGERYEEVKHHGTIIFYTYDHYNDKQDFWLEYKAFFVYGKLDKIELLNFYIEQSLKLRNEEIQKEREKELKTPWNAFKRCACYFGWRWFWRKVSHACYNLSRTLGSVQMFIIRNML